MQDMFGGLTLVALSAVFVAFNIINAAWTRSVASIGAITLGLGVRVFSP